MRLTYSPVKDEPALSRLLASDAIDFVAGARLPQVFRDGGAFRTVTQALTSSSAWQSRASEFCGQIKTERSTSGPMANHSQFLASWNFETIQGDSAQPRKRQITSNTTSKNKNPSVA